MTQSVPCAEKIHTISRRRLWKTCRREDKGGCSGTSHWTHNFQVNQITCSPLYQIQSFSLQDRIVLFSKPCLTNPPLTSTVSFIWSMGGVGEHLVVVSLTVPLLMQRGISVMVKSLKWSTCFTIFLFSDHGLGTKDAVCPTGYKCSFEVNGVACGSHFQYRKELNNHKRDMGHIKKKVAAVDEENVDEPEVVQDLAE